MNPRWNGIDAAHFDPGKFCGIRALTGALGERTLAVKNRNCFSDDDREYLTLNEALGSLSLGLECQTNSQIGELRGHVNWFPITSTGRLNWVGYSGEFFGDGDLTLNLFTPGPNAATSNNEKLDGSPGYHIEFYHRETIDFIPSTSTSFWRAVKASLGNKGRLKSLFDNRFAIVTGTFNLDGVHRLHAELHPVFAIAVLVGAERDGSGDVVETWAVMARNLGNQGDCSGGSLPLVTRYAERDNQWFVLDLVPWEGHDNPSVQIVPDVMTPHSSLPQPAPAQSPCVCIGFRQMTPVSLKDQTLFMGTIQLTWKNTGNKNPIDRFDDEHLDSPKKYGPAKLGWDRGLASVEIKESRPPMSAPGGRTLRQAADERLQTARTFDVKSQRIASIPFDESQLKGEPTTTVAYRSIPLLESPPVRYLDCGPFINKDPLCMGGWRFIPAWGHDATSSKSSQSLALFFYPHSVAFPVLNDFLGAVGWRVVGRRDQFRAREPNGAEQDPAPGTSFELAPVYQPGSVRVSDWLTISPYSFLGLGRMQIQNHPPHIALQRGIGFEVRAGWFDVEPEYRHDYYFGRAAESTVYSLGFVIR